MAESTSLAPRLMKLVARVVISPSSWKASAGSAEGGGGGLGSAELRAVVEASQGGMLREGIVYPSVPLKN